MFTCACTIKDKSRTKIELQASRFYSFGMPCRLETPNKARLGQVNRVKIAEIEQEGLKVMLTCTCMTALWKNTKFKLKAGFFYSCGMPCRLETLNEAQQGQVNRAELGVLEALPTCPSRMRSRPSLSSQAKDSIARLCPAGLRP